MTWTGQWPMAAQNCQPINEEKNGEFIRAVWSPREGRISLSAQGTKGQPQTIPRVGALTEGPGGSLYLWDFWGHSPAADPCSGWPPPGPTSGLFPKQNDKHSVMALPTTWVTSTPGPGTTIVAHLFILTVFQTDPSQNSFPREAKISCKDVRELLNNGEKS